MCVNANSYCKTQPLVTLTGDLPQRNKLAYITTDGDFHNLPIGTRLNQLLDQGPNQKAFNVETSVCSGAEVWASNSIDRKMLRFGRTGATCYVPVERFLWHQAASGTVLVHAKHSTTNVNGTHNIISIYPRVSCASLALTAGFVCFV